MSSKNINKRKTIYKRDNGRCYICQKKLSLQEMTLDHFVPKVYSGSNNTQNLRCCCAACNKYKGKCECIFSREGELTSNEISVICKCYSYFKKVTSSSTKLFTFYEKFIER